MDGENITGWTDGEGDGWIDGLRKWMDELIIGLIEWMEN